MNKHQQKTEATKRKLFKAALRIFARDGFEASRIDDIAREAGYTRGAFYAHFTSKEDLFLAILEEQSARRMTAMRELLEGCSNDEERLRSMRNFYVSHVTDRQWNILLVEFKLYALRHPRLRAKLAEAHRRIRMGLKLEAIERLIPAQLRVKPENKEQMRVGLEALLTGLVLQQAYDPAGISMEQAQSVLGICFDALVRSHYGESPGRC